jgi:hypothetical protein
MQTPSLSRIWQLGFGFWSSKTLLSAVELRVFTILAAKPLDADDLRGRIGIAARGARDFFDALVSLGLLERNDGKYSNTSETAYFLDANRPATYIGGIMEMCSVRLYKYWGSLTEALRTGLPQSESKGNITIYDVVYSQPDLVAPFASAMTGYSRSTGIALANKFPWKQYTTFADVGAAQGAIPVQIALAHQHLTGIGFDLAPVRPVFEAYVLQLGVAERLRFESGDFLEGPLPAAEVLIMGHVLHNWGLDTRKMLLRKAYEALPVNGVLIVYETLIDDDRRTGTAGLLQALNMLVELPEGGNFTAQECQGWMRDAGFRHTHVESLEGADGMIAATK